MKLSAKCEKKEPNLKVAVYLKRRGLEFILALLGAPCQQTPEADEARRHDGARPPAARRRPNLIANKNKKTTTTTRIVIIGS